MPINALIATGGGYKPPDFDYGQSKRQGLTNQLLQQQIDTQPFRRDLDEKSMQLKGLALDIKARAMELAQSGKPGPVSIDYPTFTLKGDPARVAQAADIVAQYPDQAEDPGFMPWLAEQGITFTAREQKQETGTWGSPQSGLTEDNKPVLYQVNKDGQMRFLKGVKPEPKKGMKIYDREGNLMVDMGGGAGPDMTGKTKGMVEEKLLGGREQLARMKVIQAKFKPEYQEIGLRLANTWTGLKARMGQDVSEQDAKSLTEWKNFQRSAIENINLYIKEITGAQMSYLEAKRLKLAQPDPGEKWYTGDDPITFKAKMDDIIKTTRAAVARYEYYKAKGLSDPEIEVIVASPAAIPLESLMSSME